MSVSTFLLEAGSCRGRLRSPASLLCSSAVRLVDPSGELHFQSLGLSIDRSIHLNASFPVIVQKGPDMVTIYVLYEFTPPRKIANILHSASKP